MRPGPLVSGLALVGAALYGIAYGVLSLLFLVISGASVAYLLAHGGATSGDLLTLVLTISLSIAAVYGFYLAWWAIHRRIRAGNIAGADRAALGLAVGNLLPLLFGLEVGLWALVAIAVVIGAIYFALFLLLRVG